MVVDVFDGDAPISEDRVISAGGSVCVDEFVSLVEFVG